MSKAQQHPIEAGVSALFLGPAPRASRTCRPGWRWLAAGILAFGTRAQAAQDTNRPAQSEIVVTASRTPCEIHSVPAVVYRLDAGGQVESEAARTTPDMLDGLPSVFVQKTSYGQGSPYVRGFTGFRTLCMIDGIRLNNSVFRDGPNQYWNTVDPLSLDTCELLMGPASVLYGSDAIGGSLNAMPVEPPAFDGKPAWRPRLVYRGATAENSHAGRVEVGGRPIEAVGFVGGVSLKSFGDLRGGQDVGVQEHTGYDEQDYDLRATGYLNDDTLLTLGHQTVEQDDAWRTHKTLYGLDWEGLSVGNEKVHSFDQHRALTTMKFRTANLDGPVDGIACTLSRHEQGEDLYRVKSDNTGERQGFDVTTWGAGLQLESDSPCGAWVYGAEYYRDGVTSYLRKYKANGSFQKEEIQGPVGDDASYDWAGAYAQDTIGLFDGGLDVVPGVRYSYARAEANEVKDPLTGAQIRVEDDWDAVVGSLRILCPVTRDRRHVLFAGAAQGFRAPNLSDLTRFDTARSSELETPAPDLEPEQYVSYELGVKSRVGGLSAQACCYHTQIDGMIVRTPTGRILDGNAEVTKKNAGAGYVQGVELSTRCAIGANWSAWLAGALMDGRVDAYPTSDAEPERDYVSRLMPPTAELGVRWQSDAGKIWCELVGNMADKADRLSADDRRDTQRIPPGGTPGYAVAHVRAGTRPVKWLALNLAVENILDEDYRIHGSGVNEPGRNVILTAACDF